MICVHFKKLSFSTRHCGSFNAQILCICFTADEEGVRYVPTRVRPPVTLLRHYRNPWKAAYHHFQRYTDIRVKGLSRLIIQYLIVHLALIQ